MKDLRRYFLKKIVLIMRIEGKRTNHLKKQSPMLGDPHVKDLHLFVFIHHLLDFISSRLSGMEIEGTLK